MIGRLRGRAAFDALRRGGSTVGAGPLRIRFHVDHHQHDDCARVAFAIPRNVGSAVARNRARRRVRGALAQLDQADAVPSGDYLVRICGSLQGWDHERLMTTLRDVIHDVTTTKTPKKIPSVVTESGQTTEDRGS